jgi:GntR family transcriptional regulator
LNALAGRIRLDFRADDPIFLQIVRQIEMLVSEGMLKPGDQLPTVRELAIDLRINFSTVARAYRILDEKRLISTQRGRGTYIWEDGSPGGQAGETSPPTEAANRDQLASRFAQEFIAEAIRQGFSLDEIERAFDREVASRRERDG